VVGTTDSALRIGKRLLTCSVDDYIRDIEILLKADTKKKMVDLSSAGGAGQIRRWIVRSL
jgi:hypothetical protein